MPSENLSNKSSTRPMRIQVGTIIRALEERVAALEATPKEDPKYGEAYWQTLQIKEQIEALKWRPDQFEIAGWGGEWLGVVRSWIQSNFRNGSDVIWGGHEPLIHTSAITASRLESLAAAIASATVREHMGTYVHRVKKINGHASVLWRKKTHYDWLDANLVPFLASLFDSNANTVKTAADAESYRGMISAHGDKCSQYRTMWHANGIPFPHGAAVYILSYIPPWSNTCRQVGVGNFVHPDQWVVDNYPFVKQHLPPVTEEYEQ